jgi:hypothetical protein
MLGHFIHYKGKGGLVLLFPLLIGVMLAMVFEAFKVADKYLLPLSLLLSSILLYLIDNKTVDSIGEINMKPVKADNSLMWIKMKYWAIILGIIGLVLLIPGIRN